MLIDRACAWTKLQSMDNILLLTHRSPDGDAVGSMFAMYAVLKSLGKNVRCVIDTVEKSLKMAVDDTAFTDFDEDYVVTVDVADKKLLGDGLTEKYGDRVALNIDHHGTNLLFAEDTLLEPGAAAACEVIYNMLTGADFPIDKTVAQALYIGISTDTGCFRYANTTSDTLFAAASLVKTGINNGEINRIIFETKSRAYTVFETLAMNSMRTYLDGKCAVMVLTKDMFRRADIAESEVHAINALPRQIEGVLAGVTIKERDNGTYKISIRSNEPLSAADICALMGGGGHRLAAGCELSGSQKSVINTVLKYVGEAIAELDN